MDMKSTSPSTGEAIVREIKSSNGVERGRLAASCGDISGIPSSKLSGAILFHRQDRKYSIPLPAFKR